MQRFILLDRDGTIIEDKHYLCDPAGVVLLPHVVEGLRLLQDAGFSFLVVTNQAGIGRGFYNEAAMHAVNTRLTDLLAQQGIQVSKIYFCPHAPDVDCLCRKPATGMAEAAAKDFNFPLQAAYIIGDKACDIDLAINCGAKGILVRTGYGKKEEERVGPRAHYVADNIAAAALWILSEKTL